MQETKKLKTPGLTNKEIKQVYALFMKANAAQRTKLAQKATSLNFLPEVGQQW